MALDETNMRYVLHEKTREPVISFSQKRYRNVNDKEIITIVISLSENGEYIKFFVPAAYYIPLDESAYAVLKSFAIIAWQVKMLDFEVDPDDGEVRPTIDFPIEDGTLTVKQLLRCMRCLSKLLDVFHPCIQYALARNKVHEDLLKSNTETILETWKTEDVSVYSSKLDGTPSYSVKPHPNLLC